MAESTGAPQAVRGRGSSWGERLIWVVFNRPAAMRAFGGALRRFPRAASWAGSVARRDAVSALLKREASFSNTTHAPNLVAGGFMLGMDRGTRYESDAAVLRAALARVDAVEGAGAAESKRRIEAWLAAGRGSFDLVEDYLMPVVWAGLKESFGAVGDALAEGDEARLLGELRPIAGHLVLCPVASAATQARAEQAAAALHARVKRHAAAIAAEWQLEDTAQAHRNAIGLACIGHSVSVQAGAHAMHELLARPAELQRLAAQAQQLQGEAPRFPALRRLLHDHVLELLRFRPVFPVLARDVLRKTDYALGNGGTATAEAGSSIKAFLIAAMFDPAALEQPGDYLPHREWRHAEDRYLPFGHGERACLGKRQALELLITAMAGLLRLPDLRREAGSRTGYDGPFVARMRLAFGP